MVTKSGSGGGERAGDVDPTGAPPLRLDRGFLSRLLLGALSDHEQRRLVVRLVERDDEVREALAGLVAGFQMSDSDLARRYDAAVLRGSGEAERRELLARSRVRTPDLEERILAFTFDDVFRLGEATRRLFTWSAAELLLARSARPGLTVYESRSSLQLALLVTDVVELLGALGQAPRLASLVADLRRRIDRAAEALAAEA